jgi:hypothetical protein
VSSKLCSWQSLYSGIMPPDSRLLSVTPKSLYFQHQPRIDLG